MRKLKYVKLFELFNPYTATKTKTQWDEEIKNGLRLDSLPTAYHPTKGLKGEVHDDVVEWEFTLINISTEEKFALSISCRDGKKWWYELSKNSKELESESFKSLDDLIKHINKRFNTEKFKIENRNF